MSEEAKEKLRAYGITPPGKTSLDKNVFSLFPKTISCPRCNSKNTELISQFGSTACKALYRCIDCREPFDYFKCH
jgi:ring-1,2-phenylacetyl-CoA epoxidase subunit PaaD